MYFFCWEQRYAVKMTEKLQGSYTFRSSDAFSGFSWPYFGPKVLKILCNYPISGFEIIALSNSNFHEKFLYQKNLDTFLQYFLNDMFVGISDKSFFLHFFQKSLKKLLLFS